jgi:tetratricopeptide (TPR) repeat protein
VDCTRAALALHRELGNQFGAATTLDSLGYAWFHLGRYPEAIACYAEAIEVIGDVGDRRDHAEIMVHLGDAHQAAGEQAAAAQAWRRALAILGDLDQAAAERVRARLAAGT